MNNKLKKCSCGNDNHLDSLLCAKCGKPLTDDLVEQKKFLSAMRYEGQHRYSQQKNLSIVNKIWAFFSRVKTAIVLILLTTGATILGSILEREVFVQAIDKAAYYKEKYGLIGTVFYNLRLTDVYTTWWFISLLCLICISLIICSLDRIIPLYAALSRPTIKKDKQFLQLQKFSCKIQLTDERTALLEIKKNLDKLKYKIYEKDNALLAEKGRLSRFGPYINHIGLIVFLISIALRNIPGWNVDQIVIAPPGEIVAIPNTDYMLKTNEYQEKYYADKKTVQEFKSDVTLYGLDKETLKPTNELAHGKTVVNTPFTYKDLEIFQTATRTQISNLCALVFAKEKKHFLGKIDFPLNNIKLNQWSPLNQDHRWRMLKYYPEGMDDKNDILDDIFGKLPVIDLEIDSKNHSDGEKIRYRPFMEITTIDGNNTNYLFETDDNCSIKHQKVPLFTIRIDRALPFIFIGGLIFIIGLFIGFYRQHRRIWVMLETEDNITTLYLGAHTNKYPQGLQRDLAKLPLKDEPFKDNYIL